MVQTNVETRYPRNPPASAVPRHPLLARGLCPKHLLHRSNDTGRVREVTNSRKFPCEIATEGTPAWEIVNGHSPSIPGGSGK